MNVIEIFKMLCSVPHGSGNTKIISNLIADFARRYDLYVYQDEFNNLIIKKPAQNSRSDRTVIIQGHMDMVAVKTPDCDINLATDGLRVIDDGEWLSADGTSLGGDDGIAIAVGLAIMIDKTISHPPLELVITVDEETSMTGAKNIDTDLIDGRIMLNLDSEEEGVFTVSCAGGVRAHATIPLKRADFPNSICYEITVSGLLGGHSGAEIHLGRANANKLLARFLYALSRNVDLRVANISGGEFENVICKRASAVICIKPEDAPNVAYFADKFSNEIKNEFGKADPDILINVKQISQEIIPCGKLSSLRITAALNAVPNGIVSMSKHIPGMVETSLNLGIISMTDDLCEFTSLIRSDIRSELMETGEKIMAVAELAGGKAELKGEYPGWEFRGESPLLDILTESFAEIYGHKPIVTGIHAGLECGIFAEKLKNLDVVSFGPDIENIHTVNERLNIKSAERLCELVRLTLSKLA